MAYQVPFHEEPFVPTIAIQGNEKDALPVTFHLSAAGGPDLARLKSIMFASSALTLTRGWTPDMQQAVVAAFSHGADLFVRTVDKIENLTIPVALALKAGLMLEAPKGAPRTAPIPIDTGAQFAKVCGWMAVLAYEVSLHISKISDQAGADPRFFGSSTTSRGMPPSRSGTASTAKRKRAPRETAASATPPATTGATTAP